MPDEDVVSRLVDFPHKYTQDRGLIWDTLFQFPSGRCESLVWRKYAASDDKVHSHGLKREREKKEHKPEFQYEGFISAEVGDIRSIQTTRGHGFKVIHEPSEGIHHAHVCYKPADPDKKLTPSEKTDLKATLRKCFSELVPYDRK